jgi:hypothetical protein
LTQTNNLHLLERLGARLGNTMNCTGRRHTKTTTKINVTMNLYERYESHEVKQRRMVPGL